MVGALPFAPKADGSGTPPDIYRGAAIGSLHRRLHLLPPFLTPSPPWSLLAQSEQSAKTSSFYRPPPLISLDKYSLPNLFEGKYRNTYIHKL